MPTREMRAEFQQYREWALAHLEPAFQLVKYSPFPQWVKVWLPEADEFRMLFINEAYVRKYGISFGAYFMQLDTVVWPASVAEQFGSNDREVLATREPLEPLTIEEAAPDANGYVRPRFYTKFYLKVADRECVGGIEHGP